MLEDNTDNDNTDIDNRMLEELEDDGDSPGNVATLSSNTGPSRPSVQEDIQDQDHEPEGHGLDEDPRPFGDSMTGQQQQQLQNSLPPPESPESNVQSGDAVASGCVTGHWQL